MGTGDVGLEGPTGQDAPAIHLSVVCAAVRTGARLCEQRRQFACLVVAGQDKGLVARLQCGVGLDQDELAAADDQTDPGILRQC